MKKRAYDYRDYEGELEVGLKDGRIFTGYVYEVIDGYEVDCENDFLIMARGKGAPLVSIDESQIEYIKPIS